ncbi:MAG TPA: pyridoxal phosphate-dependent aminotransferase family protein [Chitinophagaceae bacterium]
MRYNDDFLLARLQERKEQRFLRQLVVPGDQIDFASNDYLGIIRNRLLRNRPTGLHTGSGGTRILSGNYRLIEEVEDRIAAFHNAEAAVIFSSGYDANLGVVAAVPQNGDSFFFDELSHPSVKDGARVSAAVSASYAHNDVADLRARLKEASGNIFVYAEAVYDVDGSTAPLESLAQVCSEYRAHLIVNESHSVAIYGEKGEGIIHELGLEDSVFARIHGFGNACGSHGAVVMGTHQLKEFLLNFCNQLMHSTTLSEQTVSTIWEGYKILPQLWQEREHLRNIISIFQDAELPFRKLKSATPVQHLVIPGIDNVNHAAAELRNAGFDVKPLFFPAVPKGEERLRIVLHSFNTRGEVSWLIQAIQAAAPAETFGSSRTNAA